MNTETSTTLAYKTINKILITSHAKYVSLFRFCFLLSMIFIKYGINIIYNDISSSYKLKMQFHTFRGGTPAIC